MLYWALIFFIVALVAAVFGFSSIAAGAMMIARFLFFVFVALFLIALLMHFFGGHGPHHISFISLLM